jgi:hypothetical protein
MMEEELKIEHVSVYKDGGSKRFSFNDGSEIYQDFRIRTDTRGDFYSEYPKETSSPLNLEGKYKTLIEKYVI